MAPTESPESPDTRNPDERLTLPLLSLTSGVVLPQMVVTLALETEDAQTAAEAAGPEGLLLLVPKIDGQYARSVGEHGLGDGLRRGPVHSGHLEHGGRCGGGHAVLLGDDEPAGCGSGRVL